MVLDGKWIWVSERPFICGPEYYDNMSKAAEKATMALMIMGTIGCIACYIYYSAA